MSSLGANRSPALKTVGLTRSYLRNRVVRDVDLTVERGEVYGLVGANGAGKSTLMKLICGYVRPTAGTVEILGRSMAAGEAHPRVGALVEELGVYPSMSAFDNVMCRALALGLAAPRAESEKALGSVGLDAGESDHVNTFSVGTKQRLGLALALVGTPDLLILDDPFNGIDITGTRALRQAIKAPKEELGVTVLVSSHVIDQLARFVTRYGVLRKGALVTERTAERVERDCADCLCVRSPAPQRALAVLEEAYPAGRFVLMGDDEIRLDPGIARMWQRHW